MLLGNDTGPACTNPTSPTTGSGCVDLWRYNVRGAPAPFFFRARNNTEH
jgi:hypothetical protein